MREFSDNIHSDRQTFLWVRQTEPNRTATGLSVAGLGVAGRLWSRLHRCLVREGTAKDRLGPVATGRQAWSLLGRSSQRHADMLVDVR